MSAVKKYNFLLPTIFLLLLNDYSNEQDQDNVKDGRNMM